MKFTGKQRAFIDHYVVRLNGTEAARLAGYKGDDAILASLASENLRKPHIRAEIDRLFTEQVMSRDEVLKRFSDEARVDMNDFLDEHGYIDLNKARRLGKTHLIKSVTQDEIPTAFGLKYRTKLELYDGQSAKVHLGKYYKLFTMKVEHSLSAEDVKLYLELKAATEVLKLPTSDAVSQFIQVLREQAQKVDAE